MTNQWLRLWYEMPNDPKWRTIARASRRNIAEVVVVYIHLLVIASVSKERGSLEINAENLASALDLEQAAVEAILKAMQGNVLDEDQLSGWNKRQPAKEEIGSAARAKLWREKKKLEKQGQIGSAVNTEAAENVSEVCAEEVDLTVLNKTNASKRLRTKTNVNKRQDKEKERARNTRKPSTFSRATLAHRLPYQICVICSVAT